MVSASLGLGPAAGDLAMNSKICFTLKEGNLCSSAKGMFLQECQDQKIQEKVLAVDVRWKGVDDDFTVQFAMILKGCSHVTSIDFADNYIGDSGCKELVECFFQLPKLNRLVLSGNRLGDLGFAIIASLITVNSTITDLDLSGNMVRKPGMQALGSGLRENVSLRLLKIDELFFGDDGAGILSV